MANILDSYIPKFYVELNRNNDDVITVTTEYFSPEGDVYELDRRAVSPILVQTTQSLQELKPEVSNVYPFRIVTPLDFDGATLVIVPGVNTLPTASQSYYAPIYFERYNPDVYFNIDTSFTELNIPDTIDEEAAAIAVSQFEQELDLSEALTEVDSLISQIDSNNIVISV